MTKPLLSIIGLASAIAGLSAQVLQVEPNDSIATATPSTLVAGSPGWILSIGNNGDGPFGPTTGNGTGDFDFFSVDATVGQTIIFDVNSNIDGTGMDTVIGIYDSAGASLVSNDDDGVSRDSFIRYVAPADGVYYLAVGNWVAGAAAAADSLPTDANTEGTGRGVPGGAVDNYEVAVLLDGSVYFSYIPPVFPLAKAGETVVGALTLTNEGNSAATITGINISGADASAYSVSRAVPFQVPAGSATTIDVAFSPGDSVDLLEANIEIISDDVLRPSIDFDLAERAIEGLLFRLPFDDPAGSPLSSFAAPLETSGNNLLAAMVVNAGAPDPEWGRPSLVGDEGFSVLFNDAGASGNYIVTPNEFPHPETFTYSLWVRPTGGSGVDALFNRDPGFTNNDGIYGCAIDASGTVNFRIAGTDIVSSPAGAVPDDSTHHIVVTHLDSGGFGDFSADRTRLYIDGVMVAENTSTQEVPQYPDSPTNSRLWIGTRSAAGAGYNGDMDDFQLYNTELEPFEVMELFDNPGTVVGQAPRAPFQITNFVRSADGSSVDITFNSRPNRFYILEVSSDLIPWVEADDSIASGGDSTTFTFTDSALFTSGTTQFFFRLLEQ